MAKKNKGDIAWWEGAWSPQPTHKGVQRSSFYLEMRDGVKIAIDVYLPISRQPGEKIPTILGQTRYYRRAIIRPILRFILNLISPFNKMVKRYLSHGYAFVMVDARGSGASFGSRAMEWSPDEVKDGAEVVDWIIAQDWSNGKVGATGVSYDGTAAEMLLINRHPAVKAVVLRYSLFDVFQDIAMPGGIRNEYFLRTWSDLNDALDSNQAAGFFQQIGAKLLGFAMQSVAPVDEDPQGILLNQAVVEHRANYNVYATAQQFTFADDVTETGLSPDHFSPHAFLDDIQASGAAIYCWSGYCDGAYTRANINRYLNINNPNKKLVLGPWDHGNPNMIDPTETKPKVQFDDLGEILRYFDYHLKGIENGIEAEAPIHYYTMGAGCWKTANAWPPAGFQETPFYFGAQHALLKGEKSSDAGVDSYQVDFTAGSGETSRWVALVNVAGKKIGYPNRRAADKKLLIYQTPALEKATEMTGHPIITLYMKSSDPDPLFFAYLEDVSPAGEVRYVTEGQVRGLHRKINTEKQAYSMPVPAHSYLRDDAIPLLPEEVAEIVFDLQPVSYLFQAGHSIRLALAGADQDNFEIIPEMPPQWEILRTAEHASHIRLPIQEDGVI